jgi:hypothetical protein
MKNNEEEDKLRMWKNELKKLITGKVLFLLITKAHFICESTIGGRGSLCNKPANNPITSLTN